MVLIYGERTASRILTREGRLVSTVFIHLFWVPLIPLKGLEVQEMGLLRDEGAEIPINLTSVLAGYLRTLLLAPAGIGFGMLFDGLLLDASSTKDAAALVAAGAVVFCASAACWIWAMFVLGADAAEAPGRMGPRRKVLVGLGAIAAVLLIMMAAAWVMPREPRIEDIAADRSLSDEEAVRRMAPLAFPHAVADVRTTAEGIEADLRFDADGEPSVAVLEGQGPADAATIARASAVSPVFFGTRKLIRHADGRGLARIRVTVVTTVLDKNNQPSAMDVYRVNIPRDKFKPLADVPWSSDLLFNSHRVFADLGVVELDAFDRIGYRPAP